MTYTNLGVVHASCKRHMMTLQHNHTHLPGRRCMHACRNCPVTFTCPVTFMPFTCPVTFMSFTCLATFTCPVSCHSPALSRSPNLFHVFHLSCHIHLSCHVTFMQPADHTTRTDKHFITTSCYLQHWPSCLDSLPASLQFASSCSFSCCCCCCRCCWCCRC